MPIRLNLLAEAQAVEEERRRDPVKRGLWIGALLIVLVLVGSASLQLEVLRRNEKLKGMEMNLGAQTNDYRQVLAHQAKLRETNLKLTALHQLATNRFLWAPVLDALQQTTMDEVQLLQVRGDQKYELTPETKARTNEAGTVIRGTPGASTERILLTLKAKDVGPGPGDQITRFKDMIAAYPLFKNALSKSNDVRLASLSTPQRDPESGKPCVEFTLEVQFPEKERRHE